MATPIFYPSRDIADSRTRVVKAGLFLIQNLGRMPTQDQVVEALRLPATEHYPASSTGKQTVNKYWIDFQQQIAEDLDFASKLPPEIPDFAVDYLRKLMHWSQDHADKTIKDKRAILETRELRLKDRENLMNAELVASQKKQDELVDRIKQLEDKLDQKSNAFNAMLGERDKYKDQLATEKQEHAIAATELKHLNEKYNKLVEQNDSLMNRFKAQEKALSEKNSEVNALAKANQNKVAQVRELENRANELQNQADDRLAEYQEALSERNAAQQIAEDSERQMQDQSALLQSLKNEKALVDKELVATSKAYERLLKQNEEQGHVIERLSRGFKLEKETDGVKSPKS